MEPTTTTAAVTTVSPVSVFIGGVALGAGVYTGYRLVQAVEKPAISLAEKAYAKTKSLISKKDPVGLPDQARAARAAQAFEAAAQS
jgi:hypothetical protein